jgi:tetratricopeptide (TPR) repeat protein
MLSDMDTRSVSSPREASPAQVDAALAVADASGPAEEPPLAPGDVVGRYTVLSLVGCGGMGAVYKAYDPQLDRNVAIKLLRPTRASGVRSDRQLLREAQLLARLQHPNVVAVFDAGLTERGVFIAMELCDGRTLREWLAHGRSVSEILEVFRAAGRGLAAVHQAGFVHRDFKPANVLVGYDGSVRVLDFGIASLMDPMSLQHDSSSTSMREVTRPPGVTEPLAAVGSGALSVDEGVLLGTPKYMAPEQLMGERADHRSEQFSFCLCLHTALYGRSPVVGDTLEARLQAMEAGRVLDERTLLAGATMGIVPARVRRALVRGLSVDPDARFGSMQALLDELEPRVRRWPLLLALLVAAAGLGGWAMGPGASAEPCADPAAALEDVWSSLDRMAVRVAFEQSGHLRAAALHERVEQELDRYAAGWTEMYAESCRATFVTRQQSEPLHDHRMRCLQRLRTRLRSTIDALATIDAPRRAADRTVLPFVLPPLSECADLEAVMATSPLPSEPVARERIAALRRRLDDVQTLQAAGELRSGLALAHAVVDDARQEGYGPLLAEALGTLGSLQASGGSARQAQGTLEASIREASRAKDDLTAAKSWTWLLYAHLEQRDLDAGLALELAAHAAVERADDDEVRGWLLNNLGAIYSERGDTDQALRYLQQALDLKVQALGPEHVDVGISWANLGSALTNERRHAEARDAFEHAQQVFEHTVGAAHPLTHYATGNLCRVEVSEGRYARALELCTRMLEHFEASPSSNVIMGNGRFLMARALRGLGRDAEAGTQAALALELVWAESPGLAREIAAWIEAPPGLRPASEPPAPARPRRASKR